jgi:hypothetical protein
LATEVISIYSSLSSSKNRVNPKIWGLVVLSIDFREAIKEEAIVLQALPGFIFVSLSADAFSPSKSFPEGYW